MKDQPRPPGESSFDECAIRSLQSSVTFRLAWDEKLARGHGIRDSFDMDLRILDSVGAQGIPRSTESSPTSCMPVALAMSVFDIDEELSRLADPLRSDHLSKPVNGILPIGVQKGLPGPMTFTRAVRAIDSAAPLLPHLSQVEVPVLALARPRILVVDDEVLCRELLADILGDEYEILFAADGTEAMEIAVIKIPDLILLDVVMPGIDGYQVHERLKGDHRTCEIPVIFISGLGEVAAETKGLALGAVDYITKPINREPVRARVRGQIMLKLAQDKLTQLAETDGLTGLMNRSHFDKMLAYECARHLRSETELSLILLDIDHFKAFNDTYGHVRGDQCLRAVAQALAKTVSRATDIVARYGGEEFVALLPETPLKGAVYLAEKIRSCISDLGLPHRNSTAGSVTASLGVVSGRLFAGSSNMDVVHAADIELYAAKAAGRNRVSFRAIDRFGLTH